MPGSHTAGRWTTRDDSDVFGNLEIDPSCEAGVDPVPIEVEAGSVVYFGPFLVHKSAPNRSSKERRSLLFSYQPGGWAHARSLLRAERAKQPSEAATAPSR